ncbi:MAG: hypothetical protein HKN14_10285 [Marinicaulis sp.]|nr:hypothetical protein [Marinicaulis sp.]NNL90272.1 hypothetical protein [Marinicaulis sp.]
MLLRRIIEHVKAQNWTAVALDFVIVVVGVFMGIQVSSWNEARADRNAYESALLRLGVEIDANLEAVANAHAELQESVPRVTLAIDALRKCATGPDAEAAIAAGVNEAQITRGVHFRMSALKEITEDPTMLNQQTEDERRDFQDLRYLLGIIQYESDFVELKPLDDPVWRRRGLAPGPLEDMKYDYRGIQWTFPTRKLVLTVPPDEVCEDVSVIASLYEWERLQGWLTALFVNATEALTDAKAGLAR